MYGLVAEQRLGENVHVVFLLGLEHVVGNHRVEHRSSETNTVIHQHLHVVLDVLSDFEDFGAFVQRFEYFNNRLRLFTFGRNCHVKCLSFLYGEAQTYQFCVDRVD